MNTIAQQTLDTIKIVVLAAMLVVGMQYVFASPPAGATPPTCPTGQQGCDTPVNVGNNEQEKTGLLNVGGLVSRYGITVQGNIIAGNISGTSLTASAGGDIVGGSLNVGTGAVAGGQGTFTGGVKVGDDDRNTINYFQLDTYSGVADCSLESHLGRMYFRPNNHTVFVCDRVGDGIEWQGIILEPPPA